MLSFLASKKASADANRAKVQRSLGVLPVFVYDSRLCRWTGWEGFTLPGVILFDSKSPTVHTIRHEMIHWRQYCELLIVGFIAVYLLSYAVLLLRFVLFDLPWWLLWRLRGADAETDDFAAFYMARTYHPLAFEREAHEHERDPSYLHRRRFCAWWRFVVEPPVSKYRLA